MLLQQIVIYATIGTIMDYAGYDWSTPMYWCMLALVIVSNYLARKEGYEEATEVAQAVWLAAHAALREAQQHIDNKHTDTQ